MQLFNMCKMIYYLRQYQVYWRNINVVTCLVGIKVERKKKKKKYIPHLIDILELMKDKMELQ